MPATAAKDNETLDHLLSVTDLALAALGKPAIVTFSIDCDGTAAGSLPGGGTPGAHSCPMGNPNTVAEYSTSEGDSHPRDIGTRPRQREVSFVPPGVPPEHQEGFWRPHRWGLAGTPSAWGLSGKGRAILTHQPSPQFDRAAP